MPGDLSLLRTYVATRDEQALEAIIHQHQGLVYGTCLRILGNRADAEDAAQECFLKLFRHAAGVKSSLAGWLHRCATHVSLNALKQSQARHRREQRYGEGRDIEAHDPDDLTWQEISRHVDRAMEALPEELRHILVEAYLLQRPRTEIAEELGISRVTLYRRLDEGVKLLRRKLREAGVALLVGTLAILLEEHAAVAAPASLAEKLARLARAFSRGPLAEAAGSGRGPAGREAPAPPARWWRAVARSVTGALAGLALTLAILLSVYRPGGSGGAPPQAAAGEPNAPAAQAAPIASRTAPRGGDSLMKAVAELLRGPKPAEPPVEPAPAAPAAEQDEWFPLWITPQAPSPTRPAPAQAKAAATAKAGQGNAWPFAPEHIVARRLEAIEAARRADEEARRKAAEAQARRHTYREPSYGINISVSHGTVSNGQIITKSSARVTAPFPLHIHGPRAGSTRLSK